MATEATRELMIATMQKIALSEHNGAANIGAWADQSAAAGSPLAELIRVVANRERDNAFIFSSRLKQLGAPVDLPVVHPGPSPFNNPSLSDVEKLEWLYGTEQGWGALDTVAADYRAEEAEATNWPAYDQSLAFHYLSTERHSTMALLEAWMKSSPAAAASARYGATARAYLAGTMLEPPLMRPVGENLENWNAPYS